MTNELLMIAICASVVCLLLVLHSFILKGSTKPHSYEVLIMTFGADDPGDDPSEALDDWPSEIAVPADFFTDSKGEAACEVTLAAGRAGLN